MLTFQTHIELGYNPDELSVINSFTKNYIWNIFTSAWNPKGTCLLPLAILNKDKALTTYTAEHNLKADTESRILQQLATPSRTSEHPQLKVHTCKRGWTFMENYCKEQGYKYLDKESLYLQTNPTHRIRAYKLDKFIYIVTNQNTEVVESRIFSALPLLFKNEYNWDEETINYFKCFGDLIQDHTKTLKLFKEIAKKSKLLENIKYQTLKSIIIKSSEALLREAQKQQQNLNLQIADYENALIKKYKELSQINAQITFFTPDINVEEVADYIYKNPYVKDFYAPNSDTLALAIEAPLEYIDVPAFKQMLKNPMSYLYPSRTTDVNEYNALTKKHPDEFVTMLKDLFLSNKYKIYSRAEIVLDFRTNMAYPLRKAGSAIINTRPAPWKLSTRYKNNPYAIIPHMHIEYYDCWSGNKTNITKALNKKDYIGAIDICVNTVKDINVNDGAVFGRFIKQCLIRPSEFHVGTTNDSEAYDTWELPGNQYKTIYDVERKEFRTFNDIFINDYLKETATQVDFDIDFTDYIL